MSTLLDLSRIRGPREHIERAFASDVVQAADDDFRVIGDVELVFAAHRQDRRFRLVGQVRASLEIPCSRCLEPRPWPVDAAFDLEYLPMAENAGDGEREVAAEDLASAFYEEDAIDLRHLVREQLYLALPMKPLCNADCRGLCPVCGVNLNVTACGCEHRWVDPRMAPLRELLPEKTRKH